MRLGGSRQEGVQHKVALDLDYGSITTSYLAQKKDVALLLSPYQTRKHCS
jgi:hypothetical protein